jgi:O-methyltransferase
MAKIIARFLQSRPKQLTFNASSYWTLDPAHAIQATYERALQIAQPDEPGNDSKRLRSFIRQQLAVAALVKWPSLDLAECGCWRGHSTIMTAEAAREAEFHGRFSVFDSFSGLSDFTERDLASNPRTVEQQAKTKLYFAAPEQHLRDITRSYGFVDIYPGWIPTQFHHVVDRTFSFVHVDVDLHDPTRDTLQFFYPRLTAGGAIFLDDYGANSFPGASAAVDDFLKTVQPSIFLVFPLGGAALVK